MMRTLTPQNFLRVVDKFFATFVLEDSELSSGTTLLYLILFRLAGQRDACAPSQAVLARACKCSERTVQLYLHQLVSLGYIRIERDGIRNVYRLLLSDRVHALTSQAGVDLVSPAKGAEFSPSYPQNCVCIGENSSPPLRNKNIRHNTQQNFVPSPTPTPAPVRSSTPLASSVSTSSPCQDDCVLLQPQNMGVGDSCSPPSPQPLPASNPTPRPSPRSAGGVLPVPSGGNGKAASVAFSADCSTDFECLFAAWPHKQDRLSASRVFASLRRSGDLPPLDELVATVERFKAEDRAWRNGYVPNLRFWLQGHRWHDDITPVATRAAVPEPVPVADPATQAALAAQVRAVQEKFRAREESSELTATVDTLAGLWPEEPRQKLFSRLLTARLRGVSLPDVVGRATNWTGSLPPVGEWFSLAVA